MSFPRHGEIFRSDVGSSNAGSRSCGLPPALIGLDEFPVGYSLAGCSPAAPASALPTGVQCAVNSSCRSSNFQRTANSVLTGCLTPGGKRRVVSRAWSISRRNDCAASRAVLENSSFQTLTRLRSHLRGVQVEQQTRRTEIGHGICCVDCHVGGDRTVRTPPNERDR